MFFGIDCPVRDAQEWIELKQKIRFPVPEKKFDYWMGRYFFEN